MARRRKVGAIDTSTVLLIGGGAVLLLFLMNKGTTATTALPPGTIPAGGVSPTTAAINAQASEQNTIVNDASSNVSNLINSIWS